MILPSRHYVCRLYILVYITYSDPCIDRWGGLGGMTQVYTVESIFNEYVK